MVQADYVVFPRTDQLNLVQPENMCAGYACMAVHYALRQELTDPQEIFWGLPWNIFGQGVLPFGLKKGLLQAGYTVSTPVLHRYTDDEKIVALQKILAQQQVIILLVKETLPHYITLLGYDRNKEEIYAYNPFVGHPRNKTKKSYSGFLPTGNEAYTYEELLHKRKHGGVWGMYEYYSLVVK